MNDRFLLVLFLDLSRRVDSLCEASGLAGLSSYRYEILLGDSVCCSGDLYECLAYVLARPPHINFRLHRVG